MKILFISTEVWSQYNPEGIVAKKILDGLIESGNDVDVITTRELSDSGDKVYNIKVINPLVPELLEKGSKIILGIEKPIFVIKTINYLQSFDINKYDVIITRSEPISTHIIGLSLKNYKGRLIAMFSDVGFLNPYYGPKSYLRRSTSRTIERLVNKKYDVITHTNSRVLDIYSEHGFNTDKFKVFPNPLQTLPNLEPVNKIKDRNIINLAYTGSLYGKRNPSFLFKYLAEQEVNFKLYLIGAVRNMYYEDNRLGKVGNQLKNNELKKLEDMIKKEGLSDKVEILPFMSKQELNEFINENIDILVNIDAESDINLFLSSKVVDYLQYGLPILNVSDQGATVDFLNSVGVTRYLDYKKDFSFSLSDIISNEAFIPKPDLIEQYQSAELCNKLIEDVK